MPLAESLDHAYFLRYTLTRGETMSQQIKRSKAN